MIYVGWGGGVHGVLALDDKPRAEARAAIAALRQRGIEVTLLTKPTHRFKMGYHLDMP